MLQKLIKRGNNLWCRRDAITGYTYNANFYCGKDNVDRDGTFGETVVKILFEMIKNVNIG